MSRPRRFLRNLLVLLLTLGAAYALASWDWCGRWGEQAPVLLAQARAQGPLRAGAAKVTLTPPSPRVVAGYPLPRHQTHEADPAPQARALVLSMGEVRVGLVSLDVLLIPEALATAVRERTAALGLQGVVVLASHTHSSYGGYDARLVSQLAGTGRFQEAVLEATVAGASEALHQAATHLTDVTLEVGEAREPGFVRSRSEGEEPDGRLTRAVFRGRAGPVAELLIFSAHPTLIPRDRAVVDPDWPGRLALLREEQGGVALVLQGAAGNASVLFEEGTGVERSQAYARALSELAGRAVPGVEAAPRLAFARARAALPRPEASRLLPAFLRPLGDNLLCGSTSRGTEVGALLLGPLELLTVPGEPTVGAGSELLRRTGGTGVLGLADNYVGYVETPERVAAGEGESRNQYFTLALLDRLGAAAELAAQAAGFSR
jgi:hypothetical protein